VRIGNITRPNLAHCAELNPLVAILGVREPVGSGPLLVNLPVAVVVQTVASLRRWSSRPNTANLLGAAGAPRYPTSALSGLAHARIKLNVVGRPTCLSRRQPVVNNTVAVVVLAITNLRRREDAFLALHHSRFTTQSPQLAKPLGRTADRPHSGNVTAINNAVAIIVSIVAALT